LRSFCNGVKETQVVSDKTDLKEKEIGHVGNVAHIVDIAKKVTVRTIMAPQEQYQQLWMHLKKDKRFVLWALYIKRISLLKLDLEMEDGEPHNSSKTTGRRYFQGPSIKNSCRCSWPSVAGFL
jgi:hypothetical protein